ncbi:MAG TPA: hypothetical protein V6C91_14290 [Coleofasciculaceae cyanobacterium]
MALTQSHRLNRRSKDASVYPLMVASSFALLTDMVYTSSMLSVSIVTTGSIGISYMLWPAEFGIVGRWFKRYRLSWQAGLLVAVAALFFLNGISQPASAQFFGQAEQWMTGQFPQGGEVIPLVFNVLRGLFILYLGISLVKVVQAARQDEDWQNLARTPLIILIAITMGDLLSQFIIGGGGA